MSQATKRKHVVKEVLGEHMVPSDQQQIDRLKRKSLREVPIGTEGDTDTLPDLVFHSFGNKVPHFLP